MAPTKQLDRRSCGWIDATRRSRNPNQERRRSLLDVQQPVKSSPASTLAKLTL